MRKSFRLLCPREGNEVWMQQKVSYLEYGGEMTTEEVLGELARQPHLAQLRKELDPDRRFYLLYGASEEQLKLACLYIGAYHRSLAELEDDDEEEDRPLLFSDGDQMDFTWRLPVIDADQLDNDEEEDAFSVFHYCMAFLGAPGTGKTTWAKWLGAQMETAGLLHKTEMLSISAVQLKGEYVGHTAPKVHKLFQEYGILLIDEAYALADGVRGGDSYSSEVLAQLCVELEEHGEDRLVIFCGYGEKGRYSPMEAFFESNPGIRSRVGFQIFFEDFQPEELAQVYRVILEEGRYRLPEEANRQVAAYFEQRVGSPAFGNCREARNLADRTKVHMARRLAQAQHLDRESLCQVESEDIRGAIEELRAETCGTSGTKGIIGFR